MKKNILLSKWVLDNELNKFYGETLLKTLSSLKLDYPNFEKWFLDKVMANIVNGDREIILSYVEDEIAGLSILKKTVKEKKICTLRVFPKFQKNGIGTMLVEESLKILEIEKPLITVESSKNEQFTKLFKRYGFKIEDVKKDFYRIGKDEIIYNSV